MKGRNARDTESGRGLSLPKISAIRAKDCVTQPAVERRPCAPKERSDRDADMREIWQPVGESNPSYQVENLVS